MVGVRRTVGLRDGDAGRVMTGHHKPNFSRYFSSGMNFAVIMRLANHRRLRLSGASREGGSSERQSNAAVVCHCHHSEARATIYRQPMKTEGRKPKLVHRRSEHCIELAPCVSFCEQNWIGGVT